MERLCLGIDGIKWWVNCRNGEIGVFMLCERSDLGCGGGGEVGGNMW